MLWTFVDEWLPIEFDLSSQTFRDKIQVMKLIPHCRFDGASEPRDAGDQIFHWGVVLKPRRADPGPPKGFSPYVDLLEITALSVLHFLTLSCGDGRSPSCFRCCVANLGWLGLPPRLIFVY